MYLVEECKDASNGYDRRQYDNASAGNHCLCKSMHIMRCQRKRCPWHMLISENLEEVKSTLEENCISAVKGVGRFFMYKVWRKKGRES